jgi:hypothetical protein
VLHIFLRKVTVTSHSIIPIKSVLETGLIESTNSALKYVTSESISKWLQY